ncbi:MAG: ATP-binding protein [Methyloceanibacter sp.]
MKAATLTRATLRTSRSLDFLSEKGLTTQIGHPREQWPLVALKELVDNSIDACEEAGIAPVVKVTMDENSLTIEDNGPGIAADIVKDVLDFDVRVSSREAYVSPTRGAQGNALKAIVAMPYVIYGHEGQVEIDTVGSIHTISLGLDRIRQQPTVDHEVKPNRRKKGTSVKLVWPDLTTQSKTSVATVFYKLPIASAGSTRTSASPCAGWVTWWSRSGRPIPSGASGSPRTRPHHTGISLSTLSG